MRPALSLVRDIAAWFLVCHAFLGPDTLGHWSGCMAAGVFAASYLIVAAMREINP